jgi:hypothetical protein
MTESQKAKLRDVPQHLHGMYRRACAGSRKAAIAFHCLECVAWSPSEVRACTAPGCALWPYRTTETSVRRTNRAAKSHGNGPPAA